ncbi:hypothetical protein SAMN04487761_10736 [Lachnospiraceae bacterium C7]|nr:hypothetical protein SAMN04487761_10736 [Lachnospiraceae bacterium C7]
MGKKLLTCVDINVDNVDKIVEKNWDMVLCLENKGYYHVIFLCSFPHENKKKSTCHENKYSQ